MISLVYVSSAIVPFSEFELVALLEQSRLNNARADVTGMLVYKDGNFMQVLEGEEAAVTALQNKIDRDWRHCGMVTLLRTAIEQRDFPDWSMGFRNLHSAEVRAVSGYNEFLNCELTSPEFQRNPSLAHKLLLSFKKNM